MSILRMRWLAGGRNRRNDGCMISIFRILNSFLDVSCFNLRIFAVNRENSLHSL